MKLRGLAFLVFLGAILFAPASYAAYNTNAGVTVDAQVVSINYRAGGATINATSSTGNTTAQRVVTANGGIKFLPVSAIPVPVDSSPSSLNSISFSLANTGNALEVVSIINSSPTQSGLVYADAPSWSATVNETIVNLNQNQLYPNPIILYVTPSALASDGSTASVRVTASASTAGRPYGQYTGDNGIQYGSSQSVSYNIFFNIKAPVIVATKNATVLSPTANGYAGGPNDPVPGAIIQYNIRVQNIGTGASPVVEIVDRIPTMNTDFKLGTAVSSVVGTTILCSSDNGLTFPSVCSGGGVSPNITHIKYVLGAPLTSGSSASVTFNIYTETCPGNIELGYHN